MILDERVASAIEPREGLHLLEQGGGVRAARRWGRDLLVLEARPRRLEPSMQALVQGASLDVLIARPPYARGPVVVGLGELDASLAAVSAARLVATLAGAPLVAIHSIEDPIGRIGLCAVAPLRRRIAEAVGRGVDVRIASSPLDHSLLGAERELGAQLLVVAGATATSAPGAGEVALHVAAAATGPVLVVRSAAARVV